MIQHGTRSRGKGSVGEWNGLVDDKKDEGPDHSPVRKRYAGAKKEGRPPGDIGRSVPAGDRQASGEIPPYSVPLRPASPGPITGTFGIIPSD